MSENGLRPAKELHWRTFLIALGVAALIFLPFVLEDRGYFLFYGDFNVQQIPFYQMCHDAIRDGEVFWNWDTDLGVNFIGSYSFYLLGSPFFWLTIPFPSDVVPYLMAPLLVLKFALAAFTSYFYIRRFVRTPRTAMLCSLLYAFSGFSVYNIFYNHFHEAIIFFPLLLLGLETLITENRRGVFALAVFICAVSNYFFFFGMVVFTVIYWFVRTCSGCWRQRATSLLKIIGEAVIGVGLAAALLVPTLHTVLQNSRLSSVLSGWNALMYGKEQIYANILEVFFFPPDIPARPVFFPGADVKWASLGGWLPLFGMVGVIAFLQGKKGHWARRLIFICLFMALVPILNSAFYAFNSAYYARWFYMPILIMCVATGQAIDDRRVEWGSAFRWSFGITLAATLVIGLFPSGVSEGEVTGWGVYTDPGDSMYRTRYWVTCGIALLCLLIVRFLMVSMRRNPGRFLNGSIALVCAVAVSYSVFFVASGKQHGYGRDITVDQLIEGELDLGQDEETFRVDVYDGVDNTGMLLDLYSINAFHSVVPGSVTEFYNYVGEERVVASRPTVATPAIRSLLSVKYLLDNVKTGGQFEGADGTAMPGYTYDRTEDGFKVYRNDNYIPLGFAYDAYMTRAQCEQFGNGYRDDMMLKAILLEGGAVARYADILPNIEQLESFSEDTSWDTGYFSEEVVSRDCAALRSRASYDFRETKRGFTCKINLESANLVFFSVPYDDGWKAYVNGQPVKIERANIGFMAVPVGSGESEIEFRYTPPGLYAGIVISAVSVLALALYLVLSASYKKKHPFAPEYPEGEELRELWDECDAEEERLAEEERERLEAERLAREEEEDEDDGYFPGGDVSLGKISDRVGQYRERAGGFTITPPGDRRGSDSGGEDRQGGENPGGDPGGGNSVVSGGANGADEERPGGDHDSTSGVGCSDEESPGGNGDFEPPAGNGGTDGPESGPADGGGTAGRSGK